MKGWARTGDGWALNLDGSDAATGFSLPRLELHVSPAGWQSVCHLPDGTTHRPRGGANSISSAKGTALREARSVLGSRYAGILDALLAGG
jgi:hypothetical protein